MKANKVVAGVIASLVMSLIWYFATPKDMHPQSTADLIALRTPITLTLTTGERVQGELQGVDALCDGWEAAFQTDPDITVALPDGRSIHARDVASLAVGRSSAGALTALGSVSACPPTMTVHTPGSAPVPFDLSTVTGSGARLKQEIKTLTDP